MKTVRPLLPLFIVAFGALSLQWASAQSLLNVDFGVGGRSPKIGYAATGQSTNDFWNLYRHYDPKFVPGGPMISEGSLANLKQADGSETKVALSVSNAPGVWGNSSGDPMYDSYIFSQNGSNIAVRITGLEGGHYQFYVYGHADADVSAEQNSVFTLSSGTNSIGPLTTLGSPGWKASLPWQERYQYVVFRDVPVTGKAPVILEVAAGPNGIPVLNGLQIISRGTSPPRLATAAAPKAASTLTNLLFREIRYDGKVSDSEARFQVNLDVESLSTNEISGVLFEGDVALLHPELPEQLRIVSSARQYRLFASAPGTYHVKLELVAKITRTEPWNQISFAGPDAAIASIEAAAESAGVEMQLLSGTQLDPEIKGASKVKGFLAADRTLSMRWQSKTTEIARKSLVTVDTVASAQISPSVIKYVTELRYEILQAGLPRLTLQLPATHSLTRVQGEQIRDWQVKTEGEKQILTIDFIKPVEKSYSVTLSSEQPIDSGPLSATLTPPQPLEIEREAGSFSISADDMVVEIETATGLRQVNATSGTLAAYRFNDRPFSLVTRLRRVEPILKVTDRVAARLEEARLVVSHSLALQVEKAGIYSLELSPQTNFVVSDVRGEGVEDWKFANGKLNVSFASRVLGSRSLNVQLEQALKTFPDQITIAALPARGATNETAQIGAGSSLGIRIKTAGELAGLREIPVNALANHSDELLAYLADQGDWRLTLSAERLAARVVAEVFNLVTIGDGLVGGSATIRYGLINQGVREFKVRLPAHWKNVEFTGPNIRRKDQAGDIWTVTLQDKAWGGYTLVVTYDYQFDPAKASLDLSGAHTIGVERETGSVAVTTAANLKLEPAATADPLRVIDQSELAETDRALISRPVLLAYRYTGEAFKLDLAVRRHQELPVLDAVADRTQITSVLTESGEMLTQASFMVKNNDRQFQRFQLPPGATFWASYVNGQTTKAELDGNWLAVSLPRGANRDEAFAVDIVYAQKFAALTAHLMPQTIQLAAPRTDVPNTYAEWQLFAPTSQRLSGFAGSMSVARGTTYSFKDAWKRFGDFYKEIWEEGGVAVLAFGAFLVFIVSLIARWMRRGLRGALAVVAVFAIVGILAGMLLPALSGSKNKAVRIAAANNLKQIGLAAMQWANDNGGVLPSSVDQIKGNLGNGNALIDPETGQSMLYVGSGKRSGDVNAIIAYAPNGNIACFADGRVERLNNSQFAEALQRDAIAVAQLGAVAGGGAVQSRTAAMFGGVGGVATAALDAAGVEPATGLPMSVAANTPPPQQAPVNPPPGQAIGNAFIGQAGFGAGAPAPVTNVSYSVAVAAVPPPPVPPTASGIRSIRIDIPRSGQVFMFTKVLNVTDEALSVRLSAMRAKWFKIWRSVLQLTPFLAGLLVLFIQWKSARRKSLTLAVGIALCAGSVVSLLISLRALHLALIAAVPLLVAAILFGLLWRYWPRRLRSTVTSDASGPITEPLGPNGAPAIPLILVGLLVGLGWAKAENSPAQFEAPAVSNAVSVVSADYSGSVREKLAQFDVTVLVNTIATNQIIPLFGDDVALQELSVDSRDWQLLRQGKNVALRLAQKGNATVKLKLLAKVGGDITKRQLAFKIPPALSSTSSLVIDENDAEVEFPTAVSFQRTARDKKTEVRAIMGSGDRIEMYWTPRVKRINEMSASIFAQNHSLVTVGGGTVNVRTLVEYQVSQGEIRQAKLRIPAGQRLLRVEGESIRTWELNNEQNEQVLTVDLLKGVSQKYRLTIETEKLLEKLPAQVNIQVPHVSDVIRETGLIGLRGGDELSLTVENSQDLQRVDVAEFTKGFPAENLASAFRFLKGTFQLSARAEAIQPQIEAVVRNSIRAGFEQISIAGDIDYTIKKAGVFNLKVAIPAGYKIESVTAPNLQQWVERAGTNIIDLTFKERTIGSATVSIALTRLHKELPKTLDLAGVFPLEAQKLTGFISVSAEPGIAIKTTSFDGLTEIPASSLAPAAQKPMSATGSLLAFKFVAAEPQTAAGWKLVVGTETVESWVRAEVANSFSVSETLVSGRAQIRYDIQNAPLKEFRVKIPAGYTNVEISGPNIRRRDQNGEEWRVELQNKVRGTYMLTVSWEQARPAATNALIEVSGIQTTNVEREVGYVVVLTRPPLQMAQKASSDQLVPIDARELPDWANVNRSGSAASEVPVLVYRYLRPGFKLSVEARRFEEAAVLQALVDSARLTTVVADDGQMMTEMALSIRNNGLQHIEVELPKKAQVWSAFVGGQPVRPSVRDGKLMLPLERSATGDAPVSVELTYVSAEKFPRTKGRVQLSSPQIDVPLKNAHWQLYLPPDFDYDQFEGSMNHEAETVVQVFSSSDYYKQEEEKKVARRSEFLGFLSKSRSGLASGKLKGANEDFNQANYLNSDADVDSKKELDDLKREIKKTQSSNLIEAQRSYSLRNSIERSGGATRGDDGEQQQKQVAQMLDYDTTVAERQWEVLQKAQEISVAKVQPLRVNLPKRGVRHSFSQVLQTEVNKPMTVQLTATNTRHIGWFSGIFYVIAGFLMLWTAISVILQRMPIRSPKPAAA